MIAFEKALKKASAKMGVDPKDLEDFFDRGEQVTYAPEQWLFHESTPRQWAGLVIEGEVTIVRGLHGSSQHLAVLRQAGVVNTRKDGINVYYSLKSAKISEACSLTRQILLERLEDHVSLSDLIRKTGD